ncbi:hypothetical protein JSE7799_01184 [Jannaschia seosinensis]|uniref:DUF2125 domain-containing protein n=1 Tax=Jannaschia seosinensis TaxID=313367 RepID=A0A0M7B8D4_9RHOB|nr:DUF2125 domain-containing protein [Jannaschia seosinensis]CUH36160.1 hypothetical protein JSE7799_01184 [Jannaschia seosinensis]
MARLLFIVTLLAAVLWSAWWFSGRAALLRGIERGIAEMRAEGWDIGYADLSVRGFPNRFDTNVDAPSVTSPDGAFAVDAPFVQVFALSYRPQQIIAVAPPTMVLRGPFGLVDVNAGDLRASATLSLSIPPEPERATLVGEDVTVTTGAIGVTIPAMQIATRRAEAQPDGWDLAASFGGIEMSAMLHTLLDPGEVLPATVQRVLVDATLVLPEGRGLTALELRDAALVWGDMRVNLAGSLEIGRDGVPEGALTLDLRGWETALTYAESLDVVPPARVPLIRAGLRGMAADDGRVSAELVLSGGQMRLGAIPLGPAPRLGPPS